MDATRSQPLSPILYTSPNSTCFIIDIPTSISLAQHLSPLPERYPLISSASPANHSYPSCEPKSERAKENVLARNCAQGSQFTDEEWLQEAWRQLRDERYEGPWCLPRNVDDGGLRSNADGAVEMVQAQKDPGDRMYPKKGSRKIWGAQTREARASKTIKPPYLLTELEHDPDGSRKLEPLDIVDLKDRLVVNTSSELQTVHTLSLDPLPTAASYLIPAKASFFQGKINTSSMETFSQMVQSVYPKDYSKGREPGHFDIVVLDPPWQNRSVRNANKYATLPRQTDDDFNPLCALHSMLGRHITHGGIVAIWVTNNTSVRQAALDLFSHWQVVLVEELVWLKVTRAGDPVLDIASLWRKPYEVCLIGKKVGDQNQELNSRLVTRRLMVAVPDVHSRKPSLKHILGAEGDEDVRGLEIFARSLTANWCSWGDDVLSTANRSNWGHCNDHY